MPSAGTQHNFFCRWPGLHLTEYTEYWLVDIRGDRTGAGVVFAIPTNH